MYQKYCSHTQSILKNYWTILNSFFYTKSLNLAYICNHNKSQFQEAIFQLLSNNMLLSIELDRAYLYSNSIPYNFRIPPSQTLLYHICFLIFSDKVKICISSIIFVCILGSARWWQRFNYLAAIQRYGIALSAKVLMVKQLMASQRETYLLLVLVFTQQRVTAFISIPQEFHVEITKWPRSAWR